MKKILSLFLALSLLCAIVPAFAEDSIVGDWYGMYFGMVMKLTLSEDGHVDVLIGEGISGEGTWKLEGENFTMTSSDGLDTVGTYVDGVLTINEEMAVIEMGREPLHGIELADVNSQAVEENFFGDWTVKYMNMYGMLVDAETASEAIEDSVLPVIHVEKGKVSFSSGSQEENVVGSIIGENSLEFDYVGGQMIYTSSIGEAALTMKCIMLEDGMLGVLLDIDGEEIFGMYCSRVIAEAEPAA